MLRNEDVFLSHTWATIMAALCSFSVLVLVLIGYVLSSAITNDTTFYWQQLSTHPSISATIEFSIQYNISLWGTLVLDIYTFEEGNRGPEHECSNRRYGQLGNRNLHRFLISPQAPCEEMMDNNEMMVSCNAKIKISDYKARDYAFSIGFDCDLVDKRSLKGTMYNMTIYDQTNETKWEPITYDLVDRMNIDCSQFYPLTSFPNLMGDRTLREGIMSLNHFSGKYQDATLEKCTKYSDIKYTWRSEEPSCYQNFPELFCYSFIPRYDIENDQLVPPCREMYDDFLSGCSDTFLNTFDMDYKYLPLQNGTIPCYYKEVTCGPPPPGNYDVQPITKVLSTSHFFAVGSRIEYDCIFQKPVVSTCLYNGDWSSLPVCTKRIMKYWIVFAAVYWTVAFLFLIICMQCSKRAKDKKTKLSREGKYDAYVCYDSQGNTDFVTDTILPALEENHDPPMTLCIRKRDFKPGLSIIDNIRLAIKNSKSAIIIMSQDFVNTEWCTKEFEECCLKNIKDGSRFYTLCCHDARKRYIR